MSELIKNLNKTAVESNSPIALKLLELVKETNNSVLNQSKSEPKLIEWEVVNCGPYRFIGKSFYGRMGKCNEFCAAALKLDWVFSAIDGLNEYATDDIYDAALVLGKSGTKRIS